ncbi:MAG: dockerin type I domain-containing protein [Clostridiales bacterium]|nr:dockerin type I domain-containing protein [Clostridiales bacterium]
MKKIKTLKRVLSVTVALALLFAFPAGLTAAAGDQAGFTAASEFAGIVGNSTGDFGIGIKMVQVTASGNVQSVYRDAENYDVSSNTVYKGDHATLAVNGEDPALYYTTARSASMTDPRVFTVELSLPQGSYTGLGTGESEFDVSKVSWIYADRPLSGGGANAWSQISRVGSPVAVIDGENIVVTQNIQFSAFVSASNSTGDNIPYTPYYPMSSPGASNLALMGDWDLKAYYGGGATAVGSKMIRLCMNDSFVKYQELDAFAKDYIATYGLEGGTYGTKGRFLKMESFGKTFEGLDMWAAVISDSKESIDSYLNVTKPMMNEDPAALLKEIPAGGHKGVLFFNQIHGGEVAGPAICNTIFNRLLNEDTVRFTKREMEVQTERILTTSQTSTSTGGTRALPGSGFTDLTLNVNDFLDRYIVILTFSSNPEGYSKSNRTNHYAFDMNRDAAYMTQAETRAVAKAFAKWDPIYMVEFHGYYANYIIDGTTPPYEPNLEVDLIEEYMGGLCDSIGLSIIGNSPHKRYIHPSRDVVFGWDNGSTIYTPSMSMLFGSLGSTIEFPNATQDSVDAGVQGMFGLFKFCLQEWQGLLRNKVEFKRRGVENEDRKDLVDPLLVNVHPQIEAVRSELRFTFAEQFQVGRPRQLDSGGNELNFFPEYYLLPVDKEHQSNIPAVIETLSWLEECGGVKLERTTKVVTYDGVVYPAGTYVINMHQAARSFANTHLYPGYDASIYPDLYSCCVVSYPEMRGFECASVHEKGFLEGKTVAVTTPERPDTSIKGDGEYVVFKNNNHDATRLVNRLLADGKDVYMIDGYVPGAKLGDFIARRADVAEGILPRENIVLGMLALYVEGFDAGSTVPANAKKLIKPKVGIFGNGYNENIQYGLDLLEFDDVAGMTAASPRTDATVFLSYYGSASGNMATAINNGMPYIHCGPIAAMNTILGNNAITSQRLSGGEDGGEALLKGSYSGSSLLTSNFENVKSVYTEYGLFMTGLPSYMKPLAVASTGDDFFIAGHWYSTSATTAASRLKGSCLVASGIVNKGNVDVPVTYLADYVYAKAGHQIAFRIVSNAIFANSAGIMDLPRPTVTHTEAKRADGQLDVELNYQAEDTAATTKSVTVKKYKITGSDYEPAYDGTADWTDYAGAFAVNGETTLPNYVHWYVENSADVSNQGFFKLQQEEVKYVGATLSVDAESDIDKDVEYTLSICKAENLLSVELEFEVDGNMLAGKGVEALAGFESVDGIAWSYAGDGVWKGTVTLGYPSGGSTGFTSEEPVDIAKFIFAPRAAGDVAMKLTGFRAVVLDDEYTAYVESVIIAGEAVTNVDQRVFSKYDLNRDNKVDALDLGIMLLYCGFNTQSAGWSTLVKVNDSKGKGVTASMCDVNSDGIIDMLDLLDLFIHYTK